MLVKDKKLLERAWKCLEAKLGAEKNAEFIRLVVKEELDYDRLKEISDELEEERRKKAEAAEAAKPPKPPVYSEPEYRSILADYMAYLDQKKIRYSNQQGFIVFMPGKDEKRTNIVDVSRGWDGGIRISNYVGRALCDKVRPVRSLVKAIEKKYPGYRVYEETYHNYSHEITLIETFAYTTVEELHQHMIRILEAAKQVVEMGEDEFGENFEPQ
ncbi:MAG: hypothetical protein IJ088_14130 [Clostridia bacterium]|nr:hypothetical protein [Clostridia bacterium]